jgi:putative NIF3 family GTP cyclohydrolase 1 type 2
MINRKKPLVTVLNKNELSRRKFLKYSSSVVLSAPLLLSSSGGSDFKELAGLTCLDVANHFKSTDAGKGINWDRTTDTFKCGDPSKPVKKVAVAWKASWDALREAVSRGAEMFISHESICVNAQNGSPEQEVVFALPSEKPKFEWLDKTGIVVYRCHDVWDRFPKIGIRDTWQRELKLGGKIVVDEYPFYVTEVAPMTLGELARHVLKQIQPLRQNGVIVSGDTEKKISRIGTGTGQTNDAVRLNNIGADVGIMTDDGYSQVRMGVHARELGFSTIVINHGVSEEWGIMNLTKYVQQVFPSLEVFHIPQYCPYKIIAG